MTANPSVSQFHVLDSISHAHTTPEEVASVSIVCPIVVNVQKMHEMEVNFIEAGEDGIKDFSAVESGDVVILPAFGASVDEMRFLNDRKAQIIDTTCPWVSKVWTAVDRQANKEHTSIIHGKYAHEETIATASFAGDYLIVKDMDEANYVVDYILNGGDKAEFLSKFSKAGVRPWCLPHSRPTCPSAHGSPPPKQDLPHRCCTSSHFS